MQKVEKKEKDDARRILQNCCLEPPKLVPLSANFQRQ